MTIASRKTYLVELHNGNLKLNAVYILDYIKKNGRKNTFELREELTLPHQTLTSRLTALLDTGLIKVVDTITKEINGRFSSCSVYEFVSNQDEQIALEYERHFDKARKWLNNYDKYKEVLNISLKNNN